jgi:predicted kinase
VVSSDALRAVVGAGEADQSASRTAFSILHRQVDSRLRRGLLTVVDATNVGASARRPLLWRARKHGLSATAIVFDMPRALVQARNASRTERVVAAAIVDDHLARLRMLVDAGSLELEGFDEIYRLTDPLELDTATIERIRPGRSIRRR